MYIYIYMRYTEYYVNLVVNFNLEVYRMRALNMYNVFIILLASFHWHRTGTKALPCEWYFEFF